MSRMEKKATGFLGTLISKGVGCNEAKIRNRMMVAAKIADALKEKKISQIEFAKMVGRSKSEISDWLSGDRNFTIDLLTEIESVLGIHLLEVSLRTLNSISLESTKEEKAVVRK